PSFQQFHRIVVRQDSGLDHLVVLLHREPPDQVRRHRRRRPGRSGNGLRGCSQATVLFAITIAGSRYEPARISKQNSPRPRPMPASRRAPVKEAFGPPGPNARRDVLPPRPRRLYGSLLAPAAALAGADPPP